MLALFENGALTTTLVLWRMLYENFIIASFLINNDDEMSLRFNDHVVIERFKLLKPKTKEEHNEYNSLREKYGKQFKQPYGWAMNSEDDSIRSFSDIRSKVSNDEFSDYYNFSSKITHASSLSVNKSFFSDNGHGNINMLGIFSEGLELPYELTIRVMTKFAEMITLFFIEEGKSEREMIKGVLLVTEDSFFKKY